jgi:hypothetical protein
MSVHAVSMFPGELVKPVVAVAGRGRAALSVVGDEAAMAAVRPCTHGLSSRPECESCDLDDYLFNRDERF